MSKTGDPMIGQQNRGLAVLPSAPPALASQGSLAQITPAAAGGTPPPPVPARAPYPWTDIRDDFDVPQCADLDRLVAASIPRLTANADIAAALTRALGAARTAGRVKLVGDMAFQQAYDVERNARKLPQQAMGDVFGFTDKTRPMVWLRQYARTAESTLEDALHEAIHVLANPSGAAGTGRGSFRTVNLDTLDEGVTHFFTKRVAVLAGIDVTHIRAFAAELAGVETMMRTLAARQIDADVLVRAYFLDAPDALFAAVRGVVNDQNLARRWWAAVTTGRLADANALLP